MAGVGVRIHTFTGQIWATHKGAGRLVLKNADKLIGRLSTDILADSFSQLRFLINEGVVSEAKSNVLEHGSVSGVDAKRFKPDGAARAKIRKELSIPDEDTIFLYLGRLNRDKGLLDLASAFFGIGDTNVHLLVIGPDEEGIGPAMLKLAGTNAGRIHLTGFAKKPEEYIAASDVLCLPSYREGFGNAVIEAAAVGIPSIGSRICGLTDAISENETGLLFEAGDADELRKLMRVMCNDTALRSRLGQQARERALSQFTSEKLSLSWLNYYRARL
jgi:glycosyltransferase involved in cell wall biosynthesis